MTEPKLSKSPDEKKEGQPQEVSQENRNENVKKGHQAGKVYSLRDSVLTDLMSLNHVQTVYNISVAICFLLLMSSVLFYVSAPHQLTKDLQVMRWATGKMHIFGILWIFLNILCFSSHQCLSLVVKTRNKFLQKTMCKVFLVHFVAITITMFYVTPSVVLGYQLPLITAFATMCEQMRMFMKLYSFVRVNYPRITKYDSDKDGDQTHNLCPSLGHFTYYMFAPVLIYRDQYPRNDKINWSFVLNNFLKFVGCIFIAYCLFMRFIVDIFQNVGKTPFKIENLALIFAGCMFVGSTMMFLIFFSILHCWLNMFAEMLRFGDRLFYKDWWNSTTFLQYYRMWNGVVHDWIHAYFYIDIHKRGISRQFCKLNVFIVSAFAHEYVLCNALGFFFPALGIVYATVGVSLIFVTNSKTSPHWNIFMWFFLFSGWGVLTFLYSAEWYSRINCPLNSDSRSFYTIQSFSCLQIE